MTVYGWWLMPDGVGRAALHCTALQLTLAGTAQGTSYAALGYLVLHDMNIWAPNMLGLSANIICLVLIAMYPSKTTDKRPRD